MSLNCILRRTGNSFEQLLSSSLCIWCWWAVWVLSSLSHAGIIAEGCQKLCTTTSRITWFLLRVSDKAHWSCLFFFLLCYTWNIATFLRDELKLVPILLFELPHPFPRFSLCWSNKNVLFPPIHLWNKNQTKTIPLSRSQCMYFTYFTFTSVKVPEKTKQKSNLLSHAEAVVILQDERGGIFCILCEKGQNLQVKNLIIFRFF